MNYSPIGPIPTEGIGSIYRQNFWGELKWFVQEGEKLVFELCPTYKAAQSGISKLFGWKDRTI